MPPAHLRRLASARWKPGTRLRPIAVLASLVLAALTIAACGTSQSASSTTVRTLPFTDVQGTAPPITTPTVILNGKSYPVPNEGTAEKWITSQEDTGQQVIYTSKGFLPAWLFASLNTPIIFTNLSPHPVTIFFPYVPLSRHTLAPGASFSYTPNQLSFQYRATNGDWGKAQVGVFTH
jgi:hypothetical protein